MIIRVVVWVVVYPKTALKIGVLEKGVKPEKPRIYRPNRGKQGDTGIGSIQTLNQRVVGSNPSVPTKESHPGRGFCIRHERGLLY